MVTAYAKAIDSLVRKGMPEKEVFEKLRTHLKASGRMKILPQLLRELRMQEERKSTRAVVLEVASSEEIKEAEAAAAKEGYQVNATVNPSLIRGWRLVSDTTLVDRSGKRALIELYRSIVR